MTFFASGVIRSSMTGLYHFSLAVCAFTSLTSSLIWSSVRDSPVLMCTSLGTGVSSSLICFSSSLISIRSSIS